MAANVAAGKSLFVKVPYESTRTGLIVGELFVRLLRHYATDRQPHLQSSRPVEHSASLTHPYINIMEVYMVGLMKRAVILALFVSLGVMQSYPGDPKSDKGPAAPKEGFRAELLWNLGDVEKKIEDLAGAVPADKYSWRPGEGVRSVSGVYMHVVGGNYFFMTFLGVKPPMKLNPAMEDSVTDKAEIVKMLKPSFDHVRNTIINLSDKDLDKKTEMFGNTVTYRTVLLTEITHLHEHLGQSIAYARSNNVVPPWTAEAQKGK